MAWVSLSVDQLGWCLTVLCAALAQLPLTRLVAALYERDFQPFPAACALAVAALLPRLLPRQDAPQETPVSETPLNDSPDATVSVVLAEIAQPLFPEKPRLRPPTLPSAAALTRHSSSSSSPLSFPSKHSLRASLRSLPVNSAQPFEQEANTSGHSETKQTQATILHCEILNHTELAQSLPSAEYADLLNRWINICSETCEARGGEMERFGTSSFRAFFAASAHHQPHAQSAIYTALALRTRLLALSEECELRSGRELEVRFGVNTGEVLLAQLGPKDRQQLSLAGESAEWATRLASASQIYGCRILVGAQTLQLAERSAEFRPIDFLQRALPPEAPEEVFELLALPGSLTADTKLRLQRYREGFSHFRARRWSPARTALRAALPQNGTDDAILLLLQRIDEQEALAGLALDGH